MEFTFRVEYGFNVDSQPQAKVTAVLETEGWCLLSKYTDPEVKFMGENLVSSWGGVDNGERCQSKIICANSWKELESKIFLFCLQEYKALKAVVEKFQSLENTKPKDCYLIFKDENRPIIEFFNEEVSENQ